MSDETDAPQLGKDEIVRYLTYLKDYAERLSGKSEKHDLEQHELEVLESEFALFKE